MTDLSIKGNNVRYQVDDFKAKAEIARADAKMLTRHVPRFGKRAARKLERAICEDERLAIVETQP